MGPVFHPFRNSRFSARPVPSTCHAIQRDSTAAPAWLAVGLSAGFSAAMVLSSVVAPEPVQANSYSDRVAAMQERLKRMEEAKEKALLEANGSASDSSGAPSYLDSMKASLSMKIPELPAASEPEEVKPEPPAVSAPQPSSGSLFSWSKPAASRPEPAQAAPKVSAKVEAPAASDEAVPWWERLDKLAEVAATPAPVKEVPPAVPAPAPAPAPAKPFSLFGNSAPPPAPAPPAPAPVKQAEKKPEQKVVEQPKQVSKKRKGPLPMFLVQFLMLDAYIAGFVALFGLSDKLKAFLIDATSGARKALQAKLN